MKIQLLDTIQYILKQARHKGATDCEAMIATGSGYSATVRMGEVDTIEHYQDRNIMVNVYYGQRKGTATTTDLRQDALDQTIAAACEIARFTVSDPYAGIPNQNDLATTIPDLDLCHPWEITVDAAIDWCQRCEKIAMDVDPRITNSDGASLTTYHGWHALGNSAGFLDAYESTEHDYNVCVIAAENGKMQRDFGYASARHPKKLWEIERVAQEAATKTLGRLNPGTIKTGHYPVIFSPQQSARLVKAFLNAINGSRVYREETFLRGQLGKRIFPDFVTLHEDPFIPQGLGSSPYDGEGVKVQKRDLVQKGVLCGYQLDSYAARKLGLATTGNAGGAHNIAVTSNCATQAQMIQQMDTGLLITDVIGQGVDLVTGNYSRGVSGVWIEKGEIQYPVEEITLAGDLASMFKNIVAIGNDIDTRSAIHVGSIMIDHMAVASL